jgi:hypothetical protein
MHTNRCCGNHGAATTPGCLAYLGAEDALFRVGEDHALEILIVPMRSIMHCISSCSLCHAALCRMAAATQHAQAVVMQQDRITSEAGRSAAP